MYKPYRVVLHRVDHSMSLWTVRATRLYQAISMVALNVDPEHYLIPAVGSTSTEIDPNDCLEDASVRLKECSIC